MFLLEELNTKGVYNKNRYLLNSCFCFNEKMVIAKLETINEETQKNFLFVFPIQENEQNVSAELLAKYLDSIDKKYYIGYFLYVTYYKHEDLAFDDDCLSLKMNISSNNILEFAEVLCKQFSQNGLLIKNYDEDNLYVAKNV